MARDLRCAAFLFVSLACFASLAAAEPVRRFISDSQPVGGRATGECVTAKLATDLHCNPCDPIGWTATVRAMILKRSHPDDLILMTDTANSSNNLDASGFDFGWRPGWEASLVRHCSDIWDAEFRFFEIDSLSSMQSAFTGAPVNVRINTAVPVVVGGVTGGTAWNSTDLLDCEFNLRRRTSRCVEIIVGFRYLEYDDHLSVAFNSAATPTDFEASATNRLYGIQAGVDLDLITRGPLHVGAGGKTGIFHNSSGQHTELNTGITNLIAAGKANRASFAGEFALTTRYALLDHLSLSVAYNLLWLETVTASTDQIPQANFAIGTGIHPSGGVFFHGALAGLEYRR